MARRTLRLRRFPFLFPTSSFFSLRSTPCIPLTAEELDAAGSLLQYGVSLELKSRMPDMLLSSPLLFYSDALCENYKPFHARNPVYFPTASARFRQHTKETSDISGQTVSSEYTSTKSITLADCELYVFQGNLTLCGDLEVDGRLSIMPGVNGTAVLEQPVTPYVLQRCLLHALPKKSSLIVEGGSLFVAGNVQVGGSLHANEIVLESAAQLLVGMRGAREALRTTLGASAALRTPPELHGQQKGQQKQHAHRQKKHQQPEQQQQQQRQLQEERQHDEQDHQREAQEFQQPQEKHDEQLQQTDEQQQRHGQQEVGQMQGGPPNKAEKEHFPDVASEDNDEFSLQQVEEEVRRATGKPVNHLVFIRRTYRPMDQWISSNQNILQAAAVAYADPQRKDALAVEINCPILDENGVPCVTDLPSDSTRESSVSGTSNSKNAGIKSQSNSRNRSMSTSTSKSRTGVSSRNKKGSNNSNVRTAESSSTGTDRSSRTYQSMEDGEAVGDLVVERLIISRASHLIVFGNVKAGAAELYGAARLNSICGNFFSDIDAHPTAGLSIRDASIASFGGLGVSLLSNLLVKGSSFFYVASPTTILHATQGSSSDIYMGSSLSTAMMVMDSLAQATVGGSLNTADGVTLGEGSELLVHGSLSTAALTVFDGSHVRLLGRRFTTGFLKLELHAFLHVAANEATAVMQAAKISGSSTLVFEKTPLLEVKGMLQIKEAEMQVKAGSLICSGSIILSEALLHVQGNLAASGRMVKLYGEDAETFSTENLEHTDKEEDEVEETITTEEDHGEERESVQKFGTGITHGRDSYEEVTQGLRQEMMNKMDEKEGGALQVQRGEEDNRERDEISESKVGPKEENGRQWKGEEEGASVTKRREIEGGGTASPPLRPSHMSNVLAKREDAMTTVKDANRRKSIEIVPVETEKDGWGNEGGNRMKNRNEGPNPNNDKLQQLMLGGREKELSSSSAAKEEPSVAGRISEETTEEADKNKKQERGKEKEEKQVKETEYSEQRGKITGEQEGAGIGSGVLLHPKMNEGEEEKLVDAVGSQATDPHYIGVEKGLTRTMKERKESRKPPSDKRRQPHEMDGNSRILHKKKSAGTAVDPKVYSSSEKEKKGMYDMEQERFQQKQKYDEKPSHVAEKRQGHEDIQGIKVEPGRTVEQYHRRNHDRQQYKSLEDVSASTANDARLLLTQKQQPREERAVHTERERLLPQRTIEDNNTNKTDKEIRDEEASHAAEGGEVPHKEGNRNDFQFDSFPIKEKKREEKMDEGVKNDVNNLKSRNTSRRVLEGQTSIPSEHVATTTERKMYPLPAVNRGEEKGGESFTRRMGCEINGDESSDINSTGVLSGAPEATAAREAASQATAAAVRRTQKGNTEVEKRDRVPTKTATTTRTEGHRGGVTTRAAGGALTAPQRYTKSAGSLEVTMTPQSNAEKVAQSKRREPKWTEAPVMQAAADEEEESAKKDESEERSGAHLLEWTQERGHDDVAAIHGQQAAQEEERAPTASQGKATRQKTEGRLPVTPEDSSYTEDPQQSFQHEGLLPILQPWQQRQQQVGKCIGRRGQEQGQQGVEQDTMQQRQRQRHPQNALQQEGRSSHVHQEQRRLQHIDGHSRQQQHRPYQNQQQPVFSQRLSESELMERYQHFRQKSAIVQTADEYSKLWKTPPLRSSKPSIALDTSILLQEQQQHVKEESSWRQQHQHEHQQQQTEVKEKESRETSLHTQQIDVAEKNKHITHSQQEQQGTHLPVVSTQKEENIQFQVQHDDMLSFDKRRIRPPCEDVLQIKSEPQKESRLSFHNDGQQSIERGEDSTNSIQKQQQENGGEIIETVAEASYDRWGVGLDGEDMSLAEDMLQDAAVTAAVAEETHSEERGSSWPGEQREEERKKKPEGDSQGNHHQQQQHQQQQHQQQQQSEMRLPALACVRSSIFVGGQVFLNSTFTQISSRSKLVVYGKGGIRVGGDGSLQLFRGGAIEVLHGDVTVDSVLSLLLHSTLDVRKGSIYCGDLYVRTGSALAVSSGDLLVAGGAEICDAAEVRVFSLLTVHKESLHIINGAVVSAEAIGVMDGDIYCSSGAALQTTAGEILAKKNIIVQDNCKLLAETFVLSQQGVISLENKGLLRVKDTVLSPAGHIRRTVESTIITQRGTPAVQVLQVTPPDHLKQQPARYQSPFGVEVLLLQMSDKAKEKENQKELAKAWESLLLPHTRLGGPAISEQLQRQAAVRREKALGHKAAPAAAEHNNSRR